MRVVIIKMDKTSLVIAFLVAAVLAGLFIRFHAGIPGRESFMQQEAGMPLDGPGIGPYDQVSVGSVSGWAATEAAPIVSSLPSQADTSNELMLMVGNKVDPECCPGAFNTDTGCVCLTDQDKDLFAHRGGNRA
jgi:hypothetical protein